MVNVSAQSSAGVPLVARVALSRSGEDGGGAQVDIDLAEEVVSEAEASSAKRLVLAAVRAEEAVKEMRGKAKEAREKADEACGADKGRIGKTFSALAEVKEERAEAKAKAAKSYRRAEEKRSLIVEGILALSKQLRLDL